MKLKRREILAATLALSGLALSPAAMAQSEEIVKIGYSGPLSGGAAFYGKNVLDGMKFAADEINAKGFDVAGKKVKFEIIALDDQYNPSQTAINAQRLVQEDKVSVILVPHSGGIFAVQTRNEQQKLLLLAYSSLPEITERGNKLTIELPPNITDYMAPFVNYEMGKFGKKAAIAVTDSDYGKAWQKAFKAAWEKAGGQIVSDGTLSYNKSADFYSGVSRALAAKPDVMLIGGPSEPTGLVAKQARELGFKGGFAVIDQAKLDEVSKVSGGMASLDGSIGVLPTMLDPRAETQAFVKRVQKTYPDRIVGSEIGIAYVAVYAVADAMKLAGTDSDATAIRSKMDAAFKELPPSVNFYGYTNVDAGGHALMDGRVGVVEDGKVHEVKIVDLAAKK
ncbi:MAG: ethanolamine utilization protein EutJ [Burkholderiaceae bacterium]|jgi:branched-chain amino acid transport system substrate-binding protein|nr:MAG: ethanolamine utilization protein EutJ [Burkholderiaceae bacterium]